MGEDFRFKVNLGGMIEILSDHLYSSPDVYIRELLQNGADAITGKKKILGDQTFTSGNYCRMQWMQLPDAGTG